MYMGVDYYPEHWDIALIDEDISRMKAMGVNMVRIGEFAWHLMEPVEGQFDFTFFDAVIEKLKIEGIDVMFGTPTATFPAWLAKKHPSILSADEAGVPRVFGGRRQYCFNSAIYRKYAARITKEVVSHYANEPAIVVWQIDNEFGHEGSDMCHCDQCHTGFQDHLAKKYDSVDQLNEVYGTIFWGQTYNEYGEIPIPKKTITVHNPALQLDWARFRSASINTFAHEMVEIVKAYRGDHQTITTNVSGGFFGKWFDHAENVETMDFVSYDNYPVWGGLKEPLTPANIAMTHDFNRGLKDKNFWIVEQLIGAQGHDVIGYLPRPNQSKLWSMQAFAHGCSDMLFFRWRGMNRGAEQFCYGVLDHDNRTGRKYREAASIIETAMSHEAVLQSSIANQVAVLYDYDNAWSWQFQRQSQAFDYTQELMRLYTPFHDRNIPMDVIPADRDLTSYKVVVLPVQQIVDTSLAVKLKTFVEGGGTLVLSFRTGIRDRDNNLHFNQPLPGLIHDLVGGHLEEIESLGQGQSVGIEGRGVLEGLSGDCRVWRDMIRPTSATVLAKYKDAFSEDFAAILKNKLGQGQVYYIGGGVDAEVVSKLVGEIASEQDLPVIDSPQGVEVVERFVEGETYRFVLNHNETEVTFEGGLLAPFESKIILC